MALMTRERGPAVASAFQFFGRPTGSSPGPPVLRKTETARGTFHSGAIHSGKPDREPGFERRSTD